MPIPPLAALRAYADELRRRSEARDHRAVLVLAGERDWARALAVGLLAPEHRVLWVSDEAPDGAEVLVAARARQALGREWDDLVFDAFAGFDPEALIASSGVARDPRAGLPEDFQARRLTRIGVKLTF